MTTPFLDYMEEERKRERAKLVAEVFAKEGMEGLVRRGLSPDPLLAPQRMSGSQEFGAPRPGDVSLGEAVRRLNQPWVRPEDVRQLPGWLQPVGSAAREFTRPTQAALLALTAGAGPAIAGGIRGATAGAPLALRVAGKIGSALATPVLERGPFSQRLAAETALGTLMALGGQEAAKRIPEEAPGPVRLGVALAGGLAAGVGGVAGVRAFGKGVPAAGRAAARYAEESVTSPRLLRQQAGFLRLPGAAGGPDPKYSTLGNIQEDITKAEAALKGAKGNRQQVLEDELTGLRQLREDTLEIELPAEEWQRYQDLYNELAEVQIAIEVRGVGQTLVRPPRHTKGGLGFFTNEALIRLAKSEGRDYRQEDWWDSLDSQLVASYRREGDSVTRHGQTLTTMPIQKLRRLQANIQAEIEDVQQGRTLPEATPENIRALGFEPVSTAIAPVRTGDTGVQPGFSGDMAPGGQQELFLGFNQAVSKAPLADIQNLAAQEARRKAIQQGQGEFPAIPPPFGKAVPAADWETRLGRQLTPDEQRTLTQAQIAQMRLGPHAKPSRAKGDIEGNAILRGQQLERVLSREAGEGALKLEPGALVRDAITGREVVVLKRLPSGKWRTSAPQMGSYIRDVKDLQIIRSDQEQRAFLAAETTPPFDKAASAVETVPPSVSAATLVSPKPVEMTIPPAVAPGQLPALSEPVQTQLRSLKSEYRAAQIRAIEKGPLAQPEKDARIQFIRDLEAQETTTAIPPALAGPQVQSVVQPTTVASQVSSAAPPLRGVISAQAEALQVGAAAGEQLGLGLSGKTPKFRSPAPLSTEERRAADKELQRIIGEQELDQRGLPRPLLKPIGMEHYPYEPPRPGTPLPRLELAPLGDNIIGLKEIKPGLAKGERLENVLIGAARKMRLPFHPNNRYGTAAMREKSRVTAVIDSQATQLAHRQTVAIREAFPDLEDNLFVPSLEGKVTRVKGAPAIQDIADFYPDYLEYLTTAQRKAINAIADAHEKYLDLLNKVGIGIESRPSTVIGRGRYIARVAKGLVGKEDNAGVPTRGLFASETKGFQREIKFETAAEGRKAGIRYAGIEEGLRYHYRQAGQLATERHIANYLTTVTDDTNWPISVPKTGESALSRKIVNLGSLADVSFPDAVAESVNKVLRSEGVLVGRGWFVPDMVQVLNREYRVMRATLDNSFQGIQGLLLSYSHPIAAAKAAKVNFLAWKDSKVLARHNEMFDANVAKTGRLTIEQWVSEGGLHQGAQTGEFADVTLQKLPGFKQASRAYGYTGDALRSLVADALLEQEMHGYKVFGVGEIGKGRTLAEIRASGDIARIGEIVNNMTGVAKNRFLGDVGDILFFAPRFLQARLETVAKGAMGLRPGASLEQKIARRSLLKMMVIGTGLTVAINELNGQETDFRPVVNGKKNFNFMRVRALGRDWSLFGTWDSLLGLLIAAGHADASGVLRSQASGVITATWDFLSGADFLGRSVRSAENIALYVLRQIMPFSGETAVKGAETMLSGKPEDIVSGLATGVSSLYGVKSSPLSFTDRADAILAQDGTTWDELRQRRNDAMDAAIAKNKTTSAEYERLDKIMDYVAKQVELQLPREEAPRRFTMQAKQEELARRYYSRDYGELYPSQKVKINKRIGASMTKSQLTPEQFPWGMATVR